MKNTLEELEESNEKKEYGGKYDKYEVESWARTLQEAEEIKADPEKLKYAKMCMEKKLNSTKKVISSISELKSVRQEKAEKQDEATEYES